MSKEFKEIDLGPEADILETPDIETKDLEEIEKSAEDDVLTSLLRETIENEEKSAEKEEIGERAEKEQEENVSQETARQSENKKYSPATERIRALRSENLQYKSDLHHSKTEILDLKKQINDLKENSENLSSQLEGYKKLASTVYESLNAGDDKVYADEDDMIQKVTGYSLPKKPVKEKKLYTEEELNEITLKRAKREFENLKKIEFIKHKWESPLKKTDSTIREHFYSYFNINKNEESFFDDLYFLGDKERPVETLVVAYKQAESRNINLKDLHPIDRIKFFEKINSDICEKFNQFSSKVTNSKPTTTNKNVTIESKKYSAEQEKVNQAFKKYAERKNKM